MSRSTPYSFNLHSVQFFSSIGLLWVPVACQVESSIVTAITNHTSCEAFVPLASLLNTCTQDALYACLSLHLAHHLFPVVSSPAHTLCSQLHPSHCCSLCILTTAASLSPSVTQSLCAGTTVTLKTHISGYSFMLQWAHPSWDRYLGSAHIWQ